jgi:hypothetical protein
MPGIFMERLAQNVVTPEKEVHTIILLLYPYQILYLSIF